jgi:hypothetical protein
MMVLRYKYKPKFAFKPTLRLESTGFSPAGQWCGQMFKPGIFVGLKTIHECPTVTQAVEHYMHELKRCGHQTV